MNLKSQTLALLDDIERRIDPDTEEDYRRQWETFLSGQFQGDIFTPCRKKLSYPGVLPSININDAICDYEQMLVSQLYGVSDALNSPTSALSVRANYGTGILSSLFGAEVFVMPRETNTLPTTRPVNDTEKVRRMFVNGVPSLDNGLGADVFRMGELFAEAFERYPKIKRYVSVYHPDAQGSLDIAELLWGCDIFYAMYDEPELVHSVLSTVTDTYTAFMQRWFSLFPPNTRYNVQWNYWFKGSIFLRDDSAMNLSGEFYEEFARPYDTLLLERFNGGAVHFCGRGDHYIERLASVPKLYGINLSQPQLNDMEKIYQATLDRGIFLLSFNRQQAIRDISRGFHSRMNTL